MAEVTGRIGNEDVVLNNAATEATLKQLLQATLAANKQSATALQNLATSSGLNPQTVAAANQSLGQVSASSSKLGKSFETLGFVAGALSSTFSAAADLGEKLVKGDAQASDVFSAFARLPGPLGAVFQGATKLAQAQETYLKTYQDISKAGINFGGSLTEMRMAASNAYTTLEGFANLMKNNSEAFARMGGTAEQGAKSFLNVANQLQKSELGSELRSLGYTTDELNQGLATYISMTGGRNAQEMKDTRALSAAAGEYLTQLDALAQITGKAKEQQEQALKEQAANQAYQAYLLTLDEEGKKKANAALAEAMATGGKGAADALQAQMMGLPPMTKAAQEFTAVAPRMAEANKRMADAVNDSSKGMNDIKKASDDMRVAANKTKEDYGEAGKAIIMGGGTLSNIMGTIFGTANRNEQQGIKTAEDAAKQRDAIAKNQEERMKSEARDAADAQKALQELGNTILSALLPVMQTLFPVINAVIKGFAEVLTPLAKLLGVVTGSETAMAALKYTVIGLTAAFAAYKLGSVAKDVGSGIGDIWKKGASVAGGAIQGYKTGGVKGAMGSLFGSGPGNIVGALSGAGGKPDGSAERPYYVIITSGGGGGGVMNQLVDKLGDKGPGGIKDIIGKIGEKFGGGNMIDSIVGKLGAAGGGLSKLIGPAAKILGKAALPLAAGMSAYDAYKGFTADKDATMGQKLVNAGSSALNGLTFGLLGSSPEEIAARTKKPDLGPEADKLRKELEEKGLPGMSEKSDKKSMESLSLELNSLNKTMTELLKYTKEMTENTKRTMEGVKALNPNLFPS